MSLLLRGGQLLNVASATLERASVLIEGDRIAGVGPELAAPPGCREIDAQGHIVVPGLVNAHTHAHGNLLRGMGDNWSLEDQLNAGAAINAGRTAEEQYLSAAIGAVEMLKSGCTSAYDLFMAVPAPTEEGVEAVARAYIDTGARAVIAPAVADMVFHQTVPGLREILPEQLRRTVESIQVAPTEGLLRLSEGAIRRWDGAANGRIRVGVAPTIPGQSTDEFLEGCGRLVRQYGVGFHTHLLETKVQAVYGFRRWGKSVVSRLKELGLLSPSFVGAHAVWLTEDDIRLMANAGASVAHNPASNLKLGSGIAPVREMLDAGVNIGLGCDGSMNSDNQDMYEAMRFAALVNKVRFPHETGRWIGAREVWEMATAGSARILGMAEDIGAVAAGKKADLVLLRADSVYLRPMNRPLNALVYAETGADVDTVVVDGRVVVEGGRVVTVDESSLRSKAQEASDRLRAQNTALWTVAQELAPYVAMACRTAIGVPYPVNRYAVPN